MSQFAIKRDEIVKCATHLNGGMQRNTLFVFLLPSCARRLAACVASVGGSHDASLMAMFARTLSHSQLGLLAHIMWRVGRASPLGPVFVEISQHTALTLLKNIKPNIVHMVTERMVGVEGGKGAGEGDDGDAEPPPAAERGDDLPPMTTPPAQASGAPATRTTRATAHVAATASTDSPYSAFDALVRDMFESNALTHATAATTATATSATVTAATTMTPTPVSLRPPLVATSSANVPSHASTSAQHSRPPPPIVYVFLWVYSSMLFF